MGQFTPTNTWANAIKVAGTSDARQVRQVLDMVNLITHDIFPFCRLLGGTIPGQNEGDPSVTKKGLIQSVGVSTLTPEIYDWEGAPNVFRLTADTAAKTVGESVALSLDTTAGIQVDDTLQKVDQDAIIRVTAVDSSTQITGTIIYSSSGSIAWTSDANIPYIEKLAGASSDAKQVGVGVNREPTNRTNNLQFIVEASSQGILQKNLKLYASMGNDMKAEIKRMMIDVNRMRESQFIAGRKTSTGSGASRVLTSNGLIGWAESAFDNTNPGGELPWDDFARNLMPQARNGGGSYDIVALAGNDVATTLTSYAQKQKRVIDDKKNYIANVQELEVPSGKMTLLTSEFMNAPARKGQMITFQPKMLKRAYLNNLDIQLIDGLELGNELADRKAIAVCEALMASNPKSICVHTNILK